MIHKGKVVRSGWRVLGVAVEVFWDFHPDETGLWMGLGRGKGW